MPNYELITTPPNPEDYCHLRDLAGLSLKISEAVKIALSNSWFGVHLLYEGRVVGMGRIIGDGGCLIQIVDVEVLPDHQGKGLGKRIMAVLIEYFESHVSESAYINLIADGPAKDLYAQFGFKLTAPESIGMWRHR
jgi:GNAT superfamily N-acetyltransferase